MTRTSGGNELTEAMIQELASEAERGYDVKPNLITNPHGDAGTIYTGRDIDDLAAVIHKAVTGCDKVHGRIPDEEEEAARAVLRFLAPRLLPKDHLVTEEWGVLRQAETGGFVFVTPIDEAAVFPELWAREHAARRGGVVKKRIIRSYVGDWFEA